MADRLFNVGMQEANQAPTARIAPAEQRAVVSARVRLDGRGSTDPGGDPLTFTWGFVSVPIGSTLSDSSLALSDATGSSVSFSPDIVGPYVVQLTVSDGQFSSPTAEALVSVAAVRAPVCSDVLPDGRFFFRVISDYWQTVDEREVLPIIWSSYLQAAAAELLEVFQVDYDKSIETILEERQWRWVPYAPRLDLNPSDHYVVFGTQKDGVRASTGAIGDPCSGFILSPTEFVVVEGTLKEALIGEELSVLNGPNQGDYVIQRTVGRRYVIEQDNLFPDPAGSSLATAADLTTTVGSNLVRSASTDFSAVAGLEAGDYLRIFGVNEGLYTVAGVGTADGLPDDFTLQLSEVLLTTTSTTTFVVYDKVPGFISPSISPRTDVLRIPLSEDDLTELNRNGLVGYATLTSSRELLTGRKFVFDALVGQTITLTGGINSKKYIISGINTSRDGYHVTGAFQGSFPQENVPFTLPPVTTAEGRIILVNGKAYTIQRTASAPNQPAPPLGPGPVSLAILDSPMLPTGLEDVEWRVPAMLVSVAPIGGEALDFQEQGVRTGDLLVFDVEHVDNGRRTEIFATVVGVDRTRLGFELGVEDFVPGEVLEPSNTSKLETADALGIPGASMDLGSLVLQDLALDIDTDLRSLAFKSGFHNLPLWPSTSISAGGSTFRLSAQRIIRHSAIPVDPRVLSVPCLKEYVSAPIVAQSGARYALITRDGSRVERSYGPISLTENADYIIDAETDISGRDGATSAGSSIFSSLTGFFLSRSVAAGDTLLVGDDSYLVIQVLSDTELQALNERSGEVFSQTLAGMGWSLRRERPGRFLRFVPGVFTVKKPAPDTLWGEVTFIDNYEAIERNFGLMVSLSKDDLTRRNTASTTYREAVLGLMYAWAMGPRVANLRLGAQILMGLPVADMRGRILDIDDAFSTAPALGRILVEDLSPETGELTGLVRIYFFPPMSSNDLAEYAGLEVNPQTGRLYSAGDTVERFAPLSKGIIVTDYVDSPLWWAGQAVQGDESAELRKYHTWTLKAAAGVIDDNDFELAVEFARTMDPVWTEVRPVMVLPLSDTITIEDELLFHITEKLFDDPFGSIESTAMTNDLNGSSYNLNLVGIGPLSSRMLFYGEDLDISAAVAGVAVLTSARGGFIDPLTVPPHAGFPVITTAHGAPLVRIGDLLLISQGGNKGWFSISSVDSDTQIQVVQQTLLPLDSPDTLGLTPETGAEFFIFRLSRNPITSGSTSYAGVTNAFVDSNVCFFTEGVTADDQLILLDGAGRGVYTIVEVQDPGAGIYPWDTLLVVPDITTTGTSAYEIRRPSLEVNPLVTDTGLVSDGGNIVSLVGADFDLKLLRTYDDLEITTGAVGLYQILDILSPTEIYVRPAVPANANNTFIITRSRLSETVLQLGRVAQFVPYEEITLTIIRPRVTVVATAADLTASGSTFTSVTDFAASGVQPGDFLEVGTFPNLVGADDNTGTWLIDSVSATTVTVLPELDTSAIPTMARVLRDTPDFTVTSGTVDSALGGFLAVRAVPGDRFEVFSGALAGTYVVAEVVTDNQLLLTDSSVGAGETVAGRIYRLVR